MTTQEQLEKVIKKNRPQIFGYHEECRIVLAENLVTVLLSAMRIDEIRLRELWGVLYTQEPFENRCLDSGLGNAYINLIASHAQEIIKFEEE
mgnify:CR=1 FL=1